VKKVQHNEYGRGMNGEAAVNSQLRGRKIDYLKKNVFEYLKFCLEPTRQVSAIPA